MEVEKDQTPLYGIADALQRKKNPRVYDIQTLVEKPSQNQAPSQLAIIGRYILTPEIFSILEALPTGQGGELQLTDALVKLSTQQKVLGYRYEGVRFDAGDKFGFLEANLYYALKRPEFRDRLVQTLKRLEL